MKCVFGYSNTYFRQGYCLSYRLPLPESHFPIRPFVYKHWVTATLFGSCYTVNIFMFLFHRISVQLWFSSCFSAQFERSYQRLKIHRYRIFTCWVVIISFRSKFSIGIYHIFSFFILYRYQIIFAIPLFTSKYIITKMFTCLVAWISLCEGAQTLFFGYFWSSVFQYKPSLMLSVASAFSFLHWLFKANDCQVGAWKKDICYLSLSFYIVTVAHYCQNWRG